MSNSSGCSTNSIGQHMTVDIDPASGFCFGVTTAISKAEEELAKETPLHCLGDIVHNDRECQRLQRLGLITVAHNQLTALRGKRLLLRAHGEPPTTYRLARENNIQIIDATCPVVLALQRKIRQEYTANPLGTQIVIYGKRGHAEVVGLQGQTDGTAIVVENPEDLSQVDFTRPVSLYSQTTQSIEGFQCIADQAWQAAHEHGTEQLLRTHDTICRQVQRRLQDLLRFAANHDIVIFVSGRKSSNGQALLQQCLSVNPRTHLVESPDELQTHWFHDVRSVGVCGATSTPRWLMQLTAQRIQCSCPT